MAMAIPAMATQAPAMMEEAQEAHLVSENWCNVCCATSNSSYGRGWTYSLNGRLRDLFSERINFRTSGRV